MALVPLFDEVNQFNDYNGTVLAAGKLYVYHLGRTRLADIYSDLDGTVMQNPVTLDNLGRGPIYVSQDFNYTLVVMDEYGQEMFSQDKFIYSQGGPHNSANVAVGASEYIAVSSTQIGDTTVYTPYLTGDIPGPGSGGKTYSGIDPIVVNNIEDKISANTVPFGVQEPLYFVEDETATIIGISGNPSADAVNWVTAQGYLQRPDLIGYATTDFVEAEVSGKYDTSAFSTISGAFLTALPEGSMNESAFGYSGGLITSYNGSAFKAGDEFPQSATEAVELVTSNSASWNDVSGKLDTTAFSNVSGDFYTNDNPSGFITGVDLTPYQKTADMTGYATKDDISGLASADDWNDVVETVSSNSASWTGIEYTGVSPIVVDNTSRSISADTWSITFGSGLSAIDDTANSATTIVVTAQGGGSSWSEEYVDIPWRLWSTTTTTWQTIIDYANAHNGIPPKGICIDQDNAIFYPVRFHTGDYNEIYYQAIYHYVYDQTNGGVQNMIFSKKLTPNGWSEFTETMTDQADWNETYTNSWSYIRNKPHIPEIELDSSNQVSAIDGYTLAGGAGGDMFVSGLAYTTGGEISSYSGSAFASTDPTYELSAGDGISLTTGANTLTIGCTLTLATGSI